MARPILPRFEITVLKNKDGTTDTAQVPTEATIHFYEQGATVQEVLSASPFNIQPEYNSDIPIYDRGRIVEGDIVRVGTSSRMLLVEGFTDATDEDPLKV